MKPTHVFLPGNGDLRCPVCRKRCSSIDNLVAHQLDSHMSEGNHPECAKALGSCTKRNYVAETAALVTSRAFHRRLTEKVRYQLQGLTAICRICISIFDSFESSIFLKIDLSLVLYTAVPNMTTNCKPACCVYV